MLQDFTHAVTVGRWHLILAVIFSIAIYCRFPELSIVPFQLFFLLLSQIFAVVNFGRANDGVTANFGGFTSSLRSRTVESFLSKPYIAGKISSRCAMRYMVLWGYEQI